MGNFDADTVTLTTWI